MANTFYRAILPLYNFGKRFSSLAKCFQSTSPFCSASTNLFPYDLDLEMFPDKPIKGIPIPSAFIAGFSGGGGLGIYNVAGAEDLFFFGDGGYVEAFAFAGSGVGGDGDVTTSTRFF